MYFKEIEINNFRIYKNNHRLFFSPDGNKNVFVISGNNGYGKTTFLTALVWCLYGKQMKDVDDVYKTQINETGGYAKFVQSCLNRLAYREGDSNFSVSITLENISIPSVPCNNLKITRTGFYKSGNDNLEILIDGHPNEMTKEVGNEIFIQDFILPKEIAKFFFFDSEKIVSLAEIKTIAEKRQLSKAYSEVLGIKKYEDLRKNLTDLTLRFRKGSANPKEQEKFERLSMDLEQLQNKVIEYKIKLDQLEEDKTILRKISDDLQEKLIRQGSGLTLDEINNLKIEKYQLDKEIEELKSAFKELLDIAPFAIVGRLMADLKKQLDYEVAEQEKTINQELLNKKGTQLLAAFKKIKPSQKLKIEDKVQSFYEKKLEKLVAKFLVGEEDNKGDKSGKILHQFSEEEYLAFNSLFLQLKTTYASRVKEIAKTLRNKRNRYSKVQRRLSDAESKENDGVIAKYRQEKVAKDTELKNTEAAIVQIHQKIGASDIEIATKRRVIEELAKKIRIHERYKEKDKLAKRLITELDDFIVKMKREKKASLEQRILASLKLLMHKENFISSVQVKVESDIIDIDLFNSEGEEINKDTLSKGEQQLYATSILKALVEESNIEFPVFIDSPLQKFDARHAQNIIANFYPSISKQVVLFPLLNKEMTQAEYSMLEHKVKGAYVIMNEHEDFSSFMPVNPLNLFEAVKKLQAHVFKH